MLLFFKSAGDDFCGIPGDKIGDQAGTQIADCQRKEIQPAPENTVGDSEPEKQFRRIDMLKNTAVGVAVIADRCECSCTVRKQATENKR